MSIILKTERKRLIMEKIVLDDYVVLEDLVDLLETSESTVRRDLDELESEGKLHRVHGGAEKIHTLQDEPDIRQKSIKNIQAKKALVQKAAELVQDGDVIFLDAGSTTELLIPLLNQEGLTVVTNAIHHAAKLVDKNIKTLIIGGFIKNTTNASVGQIAVEQVRRLNFDKAFLGMNGIDAEHITTPEMEEAVVKRSIIASAKKAYILTDSSKLGQVSFINVASLSDVTIITNHCDHPLLPTIKEKTGVIEV
ncbi:DeoR/GlpR family DNA-binding transcription regulator [Streptococcus pluranimalium]|uniref:DeoR/GlpR family DNA-binding transcription regulator n=1 Tax=Streptococcus pluranimalium TaxID=82348 RepID=UPI003BF8B47B